MAIAGGTIQVRKLIPTSYEANGPGIGVPSRHPRPYHHHPFPPINRCGKRWWYCLDNILRVGAGMSSALWLTPPHDCTPKCPFSA